MYIRGYVGTIIRRGICVVIRHSFDGFEFRHSNFVTERVL